VQHHDVTAIGIVQTVRELVDEDTVVRVERGVHRLALDHEMGENEGAYDERHQQGDGDDDHPVEERPCTGGQLRPAAAHAVGLGRRIDGRWIDGVGHHEGATVPRSE
jgi:hypothetical protein